MGELRLFIGKMMIIEGMLSELKLFPKITQSFLNILPSFTKTPQVTLHPTKSQESSAVRARWRARCGRGEMEIITAPPIPLCTFYCPFSNRKMAAEKNEGDKLYGGGEGENSSLLPVSIPPSLPPSRLTANFSSLFRSDGTQESPLRQTNLAEREQQN